MKSLSIFVGTGECNAKCGHCAGVQHRKNAPLHDGEIDMPLIKRTMRECYEKGARSLSISSSGEPTLSPESVTSALVIVASLRIWDNMVYKPVNLYTNGIRIGEDVNFCKKYLGQWQRYGLTTMYVTVHSTDPTENAKMYGVKSYPGIDLIIDRLHVYGLKMQANLVLNKNAIGTFERFVDTVNALRMLGADSVAAWCLRDAHDNVDPRLAPDKWDLDAMERWAKADPYDVVVYREEKRGYLEGEKLTLFPDGTLSNSWCK